MGIVAAALPLYRMCSTVMHRVGQVWQVFSSDFKPMYHMLKQCVLIKRTRLWQKKGLILVFEFDYIWWLLFAPSVCFRLRLLRLWKSLRIRESAKMTKNVNVKCNRWSKGRFWLGECFLFRLVPFHATDSHVLSRFTNLEHQSIEGGMNGDEVLWNSPKNTVIPQMETLLPV